MANEVECVQWYTSCTKRLYFVFSRPYEPPETPEPDPIGPYTPEAAEAVQSASDARQSSIALRREIRKCIDK